MSFITSFVGTSGILLVITMIVLGFVFGFVYRWILKQLFPRTNRSVSKNLNPRGRILRASAGVLLLVIAVTTTYSPRLLFFAGFCFFEALFSRCGLYAALGKNECSL